MKKSLVAVSVIVVLGAAWTGASWYTGKLLEQHMADMVADANTQLKTHYPHAGLKLVYQDYHRGVFSSSVRFAAQPDGTSPDNLLSPGDEIAFLETIDHGPFPAAQLKKLNLVPSMASVHSELQNTPTLKDLFAVTQGKPLVTAETRIGYNGNTASAIDIIPVNYQKNTSNLEFAGATLNLDVAKDMAAVKLDAKSNSLAFTSPNQWGQVEKVTLSGIKLSTDTTQGKFQLGIGKQALSVDNAIVNIDGKDAAQLSGFSMKTDFGEDQQNLKGQIDYQLDSLKIQGTDFGSGKLMVKLDKLDGQALKQFSDSYNQQAMQLLQKSEQSDPEANQQQAAALLMSNLPLLLKGNPSISIQPLSWKNSKGESTFTLQLDLKDPSKAATPAQTEDQLISQYIGSLDAKLNIPLDMATELTTQTARVEGYNGDDAEKLAKQQVQGLAAMGQMFKLTSLQNNAITSSFHYADNQVDLNGQKMTLQEFAGLFGVFGAPQAPQQPAQ
ncbi:YdgA family protein [Rahnella sp. SAP-1]|uniref:YdgA family protein n=1 Tax=Rouxiella aceris TaxID=2703884 RepID=A0A848MR43_9GAMM|nr:YdgA family protein [Rouxiella aceris]NMP29773.1 YdgA family protein [Rouxiella aceris]